MSEDQTQDVKEEVVVPESKETIDEQKEVAKEPDKGSAEYNFREMRKLVEQQQRRIDELENSAPREGSTKRDETDDFEGMNADDFLTVKQAQKLAYRKAQELVQQQQVDLLEDRTRLKYRDYDDVVSTENVEKLIEDDRDLAESIKASQNPYALAYKLIKKSAFYKDKDDMTKKRSQEADKIVKNASKPVSSNAVAKPLAQANSFAQMSDDERKALYKEMSECASRRS